MDRISSLSKRGQISTLAPAIIALVIAGIFLVLGLIILQETRDTDVVRKANSNSVSNEVLTTVTESGEDLAGRAYPGAICTVSSATNSTSATAIPSSNYTTSNNGCTVAFTTGNSLGFNNSNWNVTYTYTFGDTAYTAGNETITGLGTFGSFWDIIVIAVVLTLVMGLLLAAFGGRRAR